MPYPLLSGLGLAAPAGLNAFLPLLIVALVDRFSGKIDLDRSYDFLSSGWAIALLVVLVSVEVLVDKIPRVDHFNDLIQSVVRPAAGAFLMMAINSDGGSLNPVGAMFIGLLVAALVHATKAAVRPIVTVRTRGLGNPIISTVEDFAAAISSIVAIFIPLAVPLILLLYAALVVAGVRYVRTARAHGAPPSALSSPSAP